MRWVRIPSMMAPGSKHGVEVNRGFLLKKSQPAGSLVGSKERSGDDSVQVPFP